jgi:hypothetical protein
MEVPELAASSISSLDGKVVVVDEIKVSSGCKFGLNEECGVNKETEVFVELTLGWFIFPIISIDKIPLLVETSMLLPNNDVSVLSISAT